MTDQLFDRPIQTATAISKGTSISRFTIIQAGQHGLFGDDAYQSGATWLIDTTGEQFRQWLAAHEKHARGKGQQEKELKGEENS